MPASSGKPGSPDARGVDIETVRDLLYPFAMTDEIARDLERAVVSPGEYYCEERCFSCVRHRRVKYLGRPVDFCCDDFTDVRAGWHPIYCETLDFCAECGGYLPLDAAIARIKAGGAR